MPCDLLPSGADRAPEVGDPNQGGEQARRAILRTEAGHGRGINAPRSTPHRLTGARSYVGRDTVTCVRTMARDDAIPV